MKTNLAEFAFPKTNATKILAQKLYTEKEFAQADFLTITYGASEISIVCPMMLTKPILKNFKPDVPTLHLENLAAMTVQFGEDCIETPNVYFALLRSIAVKKINLLEVISTFTELTFLVRQPDLNELFLLMNGLMRNEG